MAEKGISVPILEPAALGAHQRYARAHGSIHDGQAFLVVQFIFDGGKIGVQFFSSAKSLDEVFANHGTIEDFLIAVVQNGKEVQRIVSVIFRPRFVELFKHHEFIGNLEFLQNYPYFSGKVRGGSAVNAHIRLIVYFMTLDHELEHAVTVMQNGGVVALPTETVYGLAASILSEAGLRRIFAIKERPFFDPLIVHISDLEQKWQVISEWPDVAEFLARKFWPGPLTMVLPKHAKLNPLITSGLETVGIRMPAHPVARALIEKAGFPVAAPSANKFGKTSPTKAEHVRKGFEKEDLVILDGGQSEVGLESTVVAIAKEGEKDILTILRPGAITQQILEASLQERGLPFEVRRGSSLASPGNIEHHYMPNIPLVIVEQEELALKQNTRDQVCADFGFDRNVRNAELRLDENPRIAARSLYLRLRECSDSGAAFIFVIHKRAQEGGLWEAIWDRLSRASSRVYARTKE